MASCGLVSKLQDIFSDQLATLSLSDLIFTRWPIQQGKPAQNASSIMISSNLAFISGFVLLQLFFTSKVFPLLLNSSPPAKMALNLLVIILLLLL